METTRRTPIRLSEPPSGPPSEAGQIGQRIRARRIQLGMSRHRLAHESRLSLVTVANLEEGRFVPSTLSSAALSRVLGIELSPNRLPINADRLVQVLQAVREHIAVHCVPPTIRWLCHKTGINSTSLVRYYLLSLIREGRLVRVDSVAHGGHTGWYTAPELVEAVRQIQWK